jgi:hypothetical protein
MSVQLKSCKNIEKLRFEILIIWNYWNLNIVWLNMANWWGICCVKYLRFKKQINLGKNYQRLKKTFYISKVALILCTQTNPCEKP